MVLHAQDWHRDRKIATCNNERKVRSLLLLAGITLMAKTLMICSCSLITIGVFMTSSFFVIGHWRLPDSFTDVRWLLFTAWVLLPYFLLSLGARAACGCAARAVTVAAILSVISIGFSSYWDRAFVNLTSIDSSPLEVPLVQSVLATATWLWAPHQRKVVEHDMQAS
ncbi:MAG: hypothetical protein NTW03_00855 [Verrucomicrobia bacterium]|nr:hypothetical protein [Verrucomicrobiota bacterium]